MALDTETVLEKRRLRRRVTRWRAAAIAAAAIAVGAFVLRSDKLSSYGGHQIARVSFEGMITEKREQLKMLKKIAEAKNVDAVLVYVNSPGGSTSGGEAIYEGLRDIAKKKPVVAQFGTLAASAGYIVGLAGDHIVARGNTITGSVGVIMQWPEVSTLMDKVGVKMNEIKTGKLKATPSPFEPASEEARAALQTLVGDSFKWFEGLVETRRGVKIADVAGLKEGKVFSGREAKAARLIDEIGGEDEAVRWLEDKKGIKKNLKVVDWKPKGDEWSVSRAITGSVGEAVGASVAGFLKSMAGEGTLSALSLDGLVSVWHPSEN